ncbi:hypothetical protein PLESTB_000405200 [Pleodorina starrii]|uniref:F-box domain-containing protein n=1 Tax=Pleodorina starrii TaxID=330485 RepID=A0A9W6BF54_9CHLO|nr:hypothetical protein PLESTM_001500600 [Pleodorina starrii]GLC50665.1 hypothetical protein PLESTB_000405200 [Pleodorina starrii]GLC75277.1 hypothetical protein PLESTF_001616600 [Pleodorina starrii]
MAVETTEGASALSLADPLPEFIDHICSQFVFDGEALLTLGAVNKLWRRVVSDPALWQRLNAVRFGPEANPPAAVPAQPATAIPGWCFFPGMDSGGNDCATPEQAAGNLNPPDLAARAEQLNAVAFNTQGWIKDALLPMSRWNRYSYVPGVGMYVREEAIARNLGCPLPPPLPEEAEPIARPPDFPGWVFYQSLDSPGCDIRHPANGDMIFTSTCTTLSELAEVASRLPNCVAFNTLGYLKHNLHPLVRWRQLGGAYSWDGMYVREDVVAAQNLRRPAAQDSVMDPCIRFFQLAKTRLMATRDVDVTWLNDSYLMRVPDPDQPAAAAAAAAQPAAADPAAPAGPAAPALPPPPVDVVKLSHVCWLELNGRFNGVGPGRYRCVWLLRVRRDCNVPELNFEVLLRGARRLIGGLAAGAPAAAGGGGDIPSLGSALSSLEVRGQELLHHADEGWYPQRAGAFEVPRGAVYDVDVRLWNHGPTWKSGLMFKELRLERVEEGVEE